MHKQLRHFVSFLSITVSLSLGSTAASAANPGVVSPNDPQYEKLAAAWWQYVLSIPKELNPLNDTTGANALNEQSGKLIFLVGLFGESGTVEREITVPRGTSFFFPIVNAFAGCPSQRERIGWEKALVYTNGGTIADYRHLSDEDIGEQIVSTFITKGTVTNSLSASIDGVSIPNLTSFRAESDTFTLESLDYFGVPGPCEDVTSDGYWILTNAFNQPGTYTIRFAGSFIDPFNGLSSDFFAQTLSIKYTIHVTPKD